MKFFHGSRRPMTPHIGLCLTDDRGAAMEYSRTETGAAGHIATVEIDMGGLRVGRVERGFDESGAPGDTAEECAEYADDGFDLIKFRDESYNGIEHDTWRIVSEKALAQCSVVGVA